MALRVVRLVSYSSQTRSGTPTPLLLRLLDSLMIGNIWTSFEKKSVCRYFQENDLKFESSSGSTLSKLRPVPESRLTFTSSEAASESLRQSLGYQAGIQITVKNTTQFNTICSGPREPPRKHCIANINPVFYTELDK